jgi:hypothetical protein
MADGYRCRTGALGVATVGILAGHWLTYVLDVPHAQTRATELARTGHGYLPIAGQLATVCMAFTLASLFLDRVTRPRAGRAPTTTALVARLAALQTGAFVAMELTERAVAGAGFADLLHGGLLPLGIALQLALAVVGAILLRLVLRAADLVAAAAPARSALPDPASLTFGIPASPAHARSSVGGAVAARAPPSPVCS